MLKINNLNVSIKKTHILYDVNLHVPQGSIVALIGRNGAGKTTLMRAIMGLIKPVSGNIYMEEQDLTNIKAYKHASMQIGYMPEDNRLVPDLTVEENILVPAWAGKIKNWKVRLSHVYELIPEMLKFSTQYVSQLSGGQQKLVALSRALIYGDKLLLLDEPFEGVAPALFQRIIDALNVIKTGKQSILLSESDFSYPIGFIDKTFTIERGKVTGMT